MSAHYGTEHFHETMCNIFAFNHTALTLFKGPRVYNITRSFQRSNFKSLKYGQYIGHFAFFYEVLFFENFEWVNEFLIG